MLRVGITFIFVVMFTVTFGTFAWHKTLVLNVKPENKFSNVPPFLNVQKYNISDATNKQESISGQNRNRGRPIDNTYHASNSLVPAKEATKQQQQKQNKPYVCLKKIDRMQKTCNRILNIANMLEIATNQSTKLALSEDFSLFFEEWFDPRPNDIVLNYTGDDCSRTSFGYSALRARDKHLVNPSLMTLVPKLEYRQAAMDAIVEHNYSSPSFVSVHRRSLERQCHSRVMNNNTYCTTHDPVTANFCDIVHEDVVKAITTEDEPIVLFTDRQDWKFDNTFPIRDKQPFHVQLWMMTLSSVHFGNTASSVDYLIHHWRKGREMRPQECWPPFSSR